MKDFEQHSNKGLGGSFKKNLAASKRGVLSVDLKEFPTGSFWGEN